MGTSWTEERLDDLNHRVDEGFRRIDGDLRALRIETKTEIASLRGEMNERFSHLEASIDARFDRVDDRFDRIDARFEHVDARFEHVDARFNRVDDRFDRVDDRFDRIDDRFDAMQGRLEAMQRLMIQVGGGMIAALCTALIGLIATQI